MAIDTIEFDSADDVALADKMNVGRKQIISDGLMIYDWAFVGGGREVALSTGVVHGATRRTLSLYDVHSGRRLASWTGDAKATPPRWALRLRQ